MLDTPHLSLHGVRKAFASIVAVDDVSLEVHPGEIVALLGPNGAGKTTLLRMIVGIFQPDSGSIHFGPEVAASDGRRDPTRLGYLPEERGLYRDLPVLRTLRYFGVLRGMKPASAEAAARAWLKRFGLLDRGAEKLDAFSKGNQQKVQLVASILHAPRLAVWDEPFSGLDPMMQELLLELLRELRQQGTAVLLSAHQMDMVERVADRIVLVSRGRVIASGTMQQLRQQAHDGDARLHELFVRLVREGDASAGGDGPMGAAATSDAKPGGLREAGSP